MRLQTAFKLGRNIFFVLAILIAVGWLVFVPSAKEPPYTFVTAWGEKGNAPGQFNDPTGIAIANDEVFVSDSRNGRIQVFDLDGHFKRQFGAPGKGEGQLGRPMNLTIHKDELYVAEYFNDRIQVFSLDGQSRHLIGKSGSGPGEFNAPGGVTVAPNGDLLVPDFYNHRVQRLKADGTFVRQWGVTGEKGHTAGVFIYPTDVALDRNGMLYVSDSYANRIQVFDIAGKPVNKWGGPFAIGIPGPFSGWFRVVTGIAVGTQGDIFAADFYNHRVQKFRGDGTFLTSFGGKGSGPGQFDHVIAIAVAGDGTIFAVDFANDRIEKWRPTRS
ncbi:MAG: 6-bladed beta-propeller [Rugosibacter sp.]|nr:MAG: 6-bladed beta-propeller [Rugosibacter sp.]